MRINHNISAMVTQSALYSTNVDLSKSLQRLSTGLRINSAADDAAGLGVSENLRTQVNGTAQANRNAQDGIAVLTIAEGAGNEISSILQRMRELAVQSSNDTLTSTERAYSQQEFGSLQNEIDRISNATNYNNQQLISTQAGRFGAIGVNSTLWVDANAVNGVDSITISIGTLSANATGLNIDTQNVTTQTDAVDAISNLDTAINSVNSIRADLGAYINRLEHAINNLSVSNTNQQAAESSIRDVDFASETSNFTKDQILMQSGTAMLAQANSIPSSVLTLLKS